MRATRWRPSTSSWIAGMVKLFITRRNCSSVPSRSSSRYSPTAQNDDHVGDDRVQGPVALRPGDVLLQRPAPPPLGLVEELPVQPPQGRLQVAAASVREVQHASPRFLGPGPTTPGPCPL